MFDLGPLQCSTLNCNIPGVVNLGQFALAIETMKGPNTLVSPAGVAKLRMVNILAMPQSEPATRVQHWPQITDQARIKTQL